MQSNETIGDRIREIREKLNLTQEELAKKIDVKRETVNQWENGARLIKSPDIESLAIALNVSCDYLIRGIDSTQLDAFADTGLCGKAITKLQDMHKNRVGPSSALNKLILNPDFELFLDAWEHYREMSELFYNTRELLCDAINDSESDINTNISDDDLLVLIIEDDLQNPLEHPDLAKNASQYTQRYNKKSYEKFRLQEAVSALVERSERPQIKKKSKEKRV